MIHFSFSPLHFDYIFIFIDAIMLFDIFTLMLYYASFSLMTLARLSFIASLMMPLSLIRRLVSSYAAAARWFQLSLAFSQSFACAAAIFISLCFHFHIASVAAASQLLISHFAIADFTPFRFAAFIATPFSFSWLFISPFHFDISMPLSLSFLSFRHYAFSFFVFRFFARYNFRLPLYFRHYFHIIELSLPLIISLRWCH